MNIGLKPIQNRLSEVVQEKAGVYELKSSEPDSPASEQYYNEASETSLVQIDEEPDKITQSIG